MSPFLMLLPPSGAICVLVCDASQRHRVHRLDRLAAPPTMPRCLYRLSSHPSPCESLPSFSPLCCGVALGELGRIETGWTLSHKELMQHYIFPAGGDGLFLVVDEKSTFREDNFQKALGSLLTSALTNLDQGLIHRSTCSRVSYQRGHVSSKQKRKQRQGWPGRPGRQGWPIVEQHRIRLLQDSQNDHGTQLPAGHNF